MNHEDDDRVPGLNQLRMERAPERDLWPGIDARLKRRNAYAPPQWLAAAACAVLALTAMLNFGPHQNPLDEALSALPAVASSAPATQRVLPRAPMRSEMRGLLRANLHVVEGAQKQIRQAMAYDPDSQLLARMLERSNLQQRDLRELLAKT